MAAQPTHDVFQAIADPNRRQMLRLLSGKEMPLNAVASHFAMTRPAVSKHLRVLSEAGLVHLRKVGRETRYTLCPQPLEDLKDWLSFFEQFWDGKLAALKGYVETGEP